MKFKIYSLGCKVNIYEIESIACLLQDSGYQLVSNEEEADLVNEADQLLFQTRKALNDLQNIDPNEKEECEKLCNELEKAKESGNIADIREKKEALEKVAQGIAVKAYQQTQEQNGGNVNEDGSVDADFSDVQ